jgi:hypothetical protein
MAGCLFRGQGNQKVGATLHYDGVDVLAEVVIIDQTKGVMVCTMDLHTFQTMAEAMTKLPAAAEAMKRK